MKIKFLLTFLPLLFFGLFLFVNETLADSYQSSISIIIPTAKIGTTQIQEMASNAYPYAFGDEPPGTVIHSIPPIYKGWREWAPSTAAPYYISPHSCYNCGPANAGGDGFNCIGCSNNPFYWQYPATWVSNLNDSYAYDLSLTTGSSEGAGYYAPGYYMLKAVYPSYTSDNYYGHSDASEPYKATQVTYLPFILDGASKTVTFRLNFSAVSSYYQYTSYIPVRIFYSPIAHNGECGSNAYTFTTQTAYSGSFCNSYPYAPLHDGTGNPPFPTKDEPIVQWECSGSNLGQSVPCTARLKVSGACNSAANGQYFFTKPGISSLCTTGYPTAISGYGPWTWTCNGLNGGSNSGTCTAYIKKNGVCSELLNGHELPSMPTIADGLCDIGTSAGVSGSGTTADPWTWTCSGVGIGATATTCSAYKYTNGLCGPAAKIYSKTASNFSGALCASGSASPSNISFPTANDSVKTWTCSGSGIGAMSSPTCSAILTVDGQCNSVVTGTYTASESWPRSTDYCTKGAIGVSGAKYFYRVSAINSLGTGSAGTASATTP